MSNWHKGTQINQARYIIESFEGSIYKARDQKNHQLVAIKTILTSNSPHQKQQISSEQIKQLIKISNCHHPNLIKLYPQVFQDYNQSYIIMEYIWGQDLASYIDCQGQLPIKEALQIIEKIGSAVNVLHQYGFIHQNLKPQNIILRSQNSEPVLNDLGLTIALFEDQNQTYHNLKDPFTALEIVHQPNQIGACTDIYSLAAILYVLLTSQLPIPTTKRKNNQLISPQKLNPNISNRLNQAIVQGMKLNPLSRPQTLKQWLAMLPSSREFISDQKARINANCEQKRSTQLIKAQNNFKIASKPLIKEFNFEFITLEVRPRLFSFMSPLKKTLTKQKTQYFQEHLDDKDVIDMINIPSGTFIMGSNSNELERCPDESPQRRVRIKSFYLSKFPITQLQWRIVASLPKVDRLLKINPSYFKGDSLPVEKVSWYDATEFCQRLTKHTHRKYRLPTESEWEYACRGGTTTAFHCGEIITTHFANYDGRKAYILEPTNKYERKTTPVNSFTPNPFGLYDLHGNVWEWCQDNYSTVYKAKSIDDSSDYANSKNQPKSVRGGSWSLNPGSCRSSKRSGYLPESSYNFLGFRIICDLD